MGSSYEDISSGSISRREFLKKAGASAGALALANTMMPVNVLAQTGSIEIGCLFPLTGPLGTWGKTFTKVSKLARDHLNAAGGPLGRKLTLKIVDSTTNPDKIRDAAKKLVNVNNVPAIVGPNVRSDVVVPITKPNQVVGITPTNTPEWVSRLDDNDYHYRTTVSDLIQGTVLGELAYDQGYRSVASIYVNDPYGGPLSSIAHERFEELGGEGLSQVAYNPGKASYDMELLSASRGDPDALMLIGYVEDGITIIRESVSKGYFNEFLFPDGMKSEKIVDATGDVLEGMYGTSPGSTETPSYDQYITAFQDAYGHMPESGFSPQCYDAAILIGLAIHASGASDFDKYRGKAIRDNLRKVANPPGEKIFATVEDYRKAFRLLDQGKAINYEGASGSVDFDEQGDVYSGILIWKVENGKIKNVRTAYPEKEFKDA